MKTRLNPAIYATCALAVALLLAPPSFADVRSRHGTHGGSGQTTSPSRSNSRSGASTSRQRSNHGESGRTSEAQRRYGESHQARPQMAAPRSFPSRRPDSHPAQQRTWTRPGNDAQRPAYSNPFSQRRPAPSEIGQRWHGTDTGSQRHDDRSGWRTTPRTQQRSDGRRYSGHDPRRSTDAYGDRYRRYDSRYSGHRTREFEGRVRRLEHGTGGYRVWLDSDGDHSFWIPDARFLLFPLRIGLSVRFGAFWNSAGYYNVYDYGSYGGGYGGGYGGAYGTGTYGGGYGGAYGGGYRDGYGAGYRETSILQGYIDRFDDSNGSLVVRADSSGRYFTVLLRGDDPQFRYLQPGDWVTLSGIWTRGGYFEAYRIENLSQR